MLSLLKAFTYISFLLGITFVGYSQTPVTSAGISSSSSNASPTQVSQNSPSSVEDSYRGEAISKQDRTNYDLIPLNSLTSNSNIDFTRESPREIVLSLFGFSELRESQQQDIQVDYPCENQAVVTLTQTGLLDDSVAGMRYRVEFVASGNNWEMIWAGKQHKCYPNRGHTDWSTELCL